MKTRVALAIVIAMTGSAAADGERTPMVGGAITYSGATDGKTELVGGELELAWWAGRIGLAAEAAAHRGVLDDGSRNLAVGASARLLISDWMWPSLFEPRDVEIGVELQVIGERTWWSRDASSDALGLGLAFRMRGGSDWEPSALLAESRLFVRVMKPRDQAVDTLARTSDAVAAPMERSGVTVLVGIGASFGAGTSPYLVRFHRKPLDAD
jgi:hypothetical protein